MLIRFGYVAHALDLWEASPQKTLTFARWSKLGSEERKLRLEEVTRKNLEHTIRALHYNIAHEIDIYRMSSSIVPLATHMEVPWDYIKPFKELYQEIGELVKKHKLRTSFHPNQFTLFTSDKGHVTENAVRDMEYHYALAEAMGLEKMIHINIHVGGAYGDKKNAVARFHDNLRKLPNHIKAQMTLENDDKTYTATETLEICEKENIPMMFDYHHFAANHEDDESLEGLLPRIFQTWAGKEYVPKVHVSSPKSEQAFRSHAEYVDVDFLMPFLTELKNIGQPIDFMVEAKGKDLALRRLVEEISAIRGVRRVKGAAVEW
ncbi:UV DNA damage repair endonuclease UvsE [Thalassobacillus pellis]|uniref:UV DNA damage repair endonuclease UvsE n=1 Tax=Thalassobacillus pellis TaxID=748008 RepID=UPI001961069C|nr:UV DNA damage repair endonuclease UvsE [Thalassobacillus pellis]MBM7554177.1 UV DNA damage endonuclease [Thalassobacillus pellis]